MTLATTRSADCDWTPYIGDFSFAFAHFPPGARVLDVGFGRGAQMRQIEKQGARAFGVEYGKERAARARAAGLKVCQGSAEELPIATASIDGVICKVVIMYTDEARSIRELARVLRPGGIACVAYHGLGYSLKYLVSGPGWGRRVYGLRTILNTGVYRATGRRLPGFWGDTVFQTTRRLKQYYRSAGLELVTEHSPASFAGAPVFIYHTLRKSA